MRKGPSRLPAHPTLSPVPGKEGRGRGRARAMQSHPWAPLPNVSCLSPPVSLDACLPPFHLPQILLVICSAS